MWRVTTSTGQLKGAGASGPTGPGGLGSVLTNVDTGTVNDWIPTGSTGVSSVIEWSGTGDITVNGLASGVSGQSFYFKNLNNVTGSVAYFNPSNTGSATGNRLITAITSGKTPVAGGGYIRFIWDGTNWKLIHHEQGAWINVPYASGNFTASASMTWTVSSGNQISYTFRLDGSTLYAQFTLNNTTVGGTPDFGLRVALPNGYTWSSAAGNKTNLPIRALNAGVEGIGFCLANASVGYIDCRAASFGTWANSSSGTTVQGNAYAPID